ncbi:unnamed protein product [Camellia sinensis]
MAKSQNSKFKCFSGILRSLLYIGNLPTQPSDPTTDIPTTTTTFENPKKNFKTQVRTPGLVARLMSLDLLPDPKKVFRRKEDQKEKSGCTSLFIDSINFSKTYRQWTASVSSQRDGKPYEHRSNRKDSMAQQECKDEYEVLETSKVERSSYPAKRTINSKLSEAEMAYIQQKFMADHGTFGQVLECLDNKKLEHLAIMERLLGPLPLPQHMIISAERSARLDWLEGASSKESTRAVWKLPRLQFRTLGVVARLMVHVDGRPQNVIAKLMGLDGLPPQQPLHRQHKGFSKTYRQRTTSVSPQKDGKPYEHRSNRKDSMAQQECKDEYEVLETSKVEKSSYPAKRSINSKLSEAEMRTFGQVLECLDNENLEHLAMMERLLGPLPQPFILRNISRGVHAWIG